MLKLITLFIVALGQFSLFANVELIQQFDQRQYSPVKYGLKDLTFEVRIEKLDEELKQRFALDKVNDPHFKVYWVYPGRTEIEVNGLPPGFEALKNELKKLVIERIEYVVPQDMSGRLRGYEFETSRGPAGETLLKGTDRTHGNVISQIHLTFAGDAQLRTMKTFSPSGAQTAKFESGTKSWSHNKRVVEKVLLEGVTGIQKTSVITTIDYISKDGFGFPSKISTETTIEAMTNQKGESQESMTSNVIFANHNVNSGEAKKYFMEQDAP